MSSSEPTASDQQLSARSSEGEDPSLPADTRIIHAHTNKHTRAPGAENLLSLHRKGKRALSDRLGALQGG